MTNNHRRLEREVEQLERSLRRQARQARIRTLQAMRKTLQVADAEERKRRAQGLRIAWARLPRRRSPSGGSKPAKRRLHLGRARHRGTHTIHVRLEQTHSSEKAVKHQRYIERNGACIASFGNIGDTSAERERLWRELDLRGVRRAGRIALEPGLAPQAKRAVLEALKETSEAAPGGMHRHEVDRLLALDEEQLDRERITIRTEDGETHDRLIQTAQHCAEKCRASPELPGATSRFDERRQPDDNAPIPGLRISRGRDAAVAVRDRVSPVARQAIAKLFDSALGARQAGLTPETWERWLATGAPGESGVLRTRTARFAEQIATAARRAAKLSDDDPGVQITSRSVTEFRLHRGAPPGLKRVLVDWWDEHHPGVAPWPKKGDAERWSRIGSAALGALDDETLAVPVFGKEVSGLKRHLEREAKRIRKEGTEHEWTSRHEPPQHRGRGPKISGLRASRPKEPIVQRRIIMELAHELPLEDQQAALRAWCERNLRGLAWHAVIHQPEDRNDQRNWHAHVVYSNVEVKRRENGVGWTFEDTGRRPKPNETIRHLSGNGPLKGQGRNQLIRRWRKDLCDLQNVRLHERGADKRYDPRSYAGMGIQAQAGRHLGPARFRREAEEDSRATGIPSPYWKDIEAALEGRLRREGASPEAMELASDVLELTRLARGFPKENGAAAKSQLERERDAAAEELARIASEEVLRAADGELERWVGPLPRRRRKQLAHEIRVWAEVCRGAVNPEDVRETTGLLLEGNPEALAERPELARRFTQIAERAAIAAAFRADWTRCRTKEAVQTLRARHPAVAATLTAIERRALAHDLPNGRKAVAIAIRASELAATPGHEASERLRKLTPPMLKLIALVKPRTAASVRTRLEEEARRDQALDAAIQETGPEPDARAWLALEHAHPDAAARRPAAGAAIEEAWQSVKADLRNEVAEFETLDPIDSQHRALALSRSLAPHRLTALEAEPDELARLAREGAAQETRIRNSAKETCERAAQGDFGAREELEALHREPKRARWLDPATLARVDAALENDAGPRLPFASRDGVER